MQDSLSLPGEGSALLNPERERTAPALAFKLSARLSPRGRWAWSITVLGLNQAYKGKEKLKSPSTNVSSLSEGAGISGRGDAHPARAPALPAASVTAHADLHEQSCCCAILL